ncbi:hypothetical protein A3A46_03230 [Candidatus Roizmanbacteria bacterium RIFCSPLOWO2_01_FULL_37_13]|uniref:Glycosyltransferase RgtA/B/C/D-like domain-containing protein n=1 Tax=Candidatus Roizmanbacteria bacterium RIFCSPHIGHO2_02_FULL_38_11 TaxID=1802039 RepID=A0A1F7GX26_9BACT|nr:MAG: hypothetical protein A3C25_02065 [Candidatus Roizmanbacteria bacterium RIFCSPHIGHO2_02_FULL_38_11]OGK43144.1 MAG: hypothetical protein A3A46_03230 [Candidatus Roizmanbacteria bacterium RIFCSPLOWO2_01_FULL_37_13]
MRSVFDYIRKHKFLLLIVLPAFLLYMLIIFPSGTFLCFKDACGINFWGVHGHDAIWHLAIANVSFNKFPFTAPTFAGENLYGYNYLLDFFIFLLSKIGIPTILSYFKLLPAIWFVAFTTLLIILGRKIKDSSLFVSLFLFLSYLAGSFSYLLTLFHDKTINGSSTLLPQPIMHMMSNLPYAFSLLPFLVILILMKEKDLNVKNVLIMGICVFLIMGLKFYGGVISIFMVVIFVILNLLQDLLSKNQIPKQVRNDNVRKSIIGFIAIAGFVVTGLFFFYDPIRSFKTGSVFGFAPFALVHPITETPNQFYLRDLTNARYYILAQGRIGPRFIWIEFVNLTLFLFFYLGTRIFGLFYIGIILTKATVSFLRKPSLTWRKQESRKITGSPIRSGMTLQNNKRDKFDIAVCFSILFSILLTVTLVQKAEWWNTIQFFFYAIFLLTIYLSKLVYTLTNTRKIILIIPATMILLLSIPTSIDLVRLFAVAPGAAYLSVDEMKALEFLKKQPEGIILTPLYNKEWKNYQKPNQLYTYEDTAYISAFSGKQTYFANVLQLRLTGAPYEKRFARLKNMDCSILGEVDYIYDIRRLLDSEKIVVKCKPKNVRKIFENKSINIYSRIK